jgi:hypothetical protein
MKFLKWTGIVVLILVVIALIAMPIMRNNTKKHSPEDTYTYKANGLDIEINYSRPFKKDRVIFGELVPYDEVWRTGANEATTFKTATDITVKEEVLPAGTYTLWTVPRKGEWDIIFNKGAYDWGVDFNWSSRSVVAARDPELDVLTVKAKPERYFKVYEQFTIQVEGQPERLLLSWDDIGVSVPIAKK